MKLHMYITRDRSTGAFERGHNWTTYLPIFKPDIVLLNVGRHGLGLVRTAMVQINTTRRLAPSGTADRHAKKAWERRTLCGA